MPSIWSVKTDKLEILLIGAKFHLNTLSGSWVSVWDACWGIWCMYWTAEINLLNKFKNKFLNSLHLVNTKL